MKRKADLLALVAVCLSGFIFAGFYRMQFHSYAQVYSDSLSPFAAAVKVIYTGWSNPPNPESDHWAWVAAIPMILKAHTLEELFALRFWLGAVVVPIAALILWVGDETRKYWAMVLASLLLAVDSGLIDTLISAFRGYAAPEIFAVATLGYVLFIRGQWWGAIIASVATIVAGGQHPLALGCCLAVAWLWWRLYQQSPKQFLITIVCSLFALVPRILWGIELLQCDAGGLACLQNIALSSSEDQSIGHLLWRVVHDRFWIELGWGGGILLMGCYLGRKNPLATWVLLSVGGIMLLGLSISTLRPYHFRVLAVPMVCWSVQGWLNKPRILLALMPVWLWGYIMQPPEVIPIRNTLMEHDELAKCLCQRQTPFWIDGYQTKEQWNVSVQGIGISMALQGCTNITDPTPRESLLLLSDSELDYPRSCKAGGYGVYVVDDPIEIQKLPREHLYSGFDIATLFFSDEDIVLRW